MLHVVLLHVTPQLRAKYEAALAGVPHTLTHWVSKGSQLSAGYDERNHSKGPGLAARYRTLRAFLQSETPWRAGDRVCVCCYSAAGWAARYWFRQPETRELCDCLVLLDGLHAGRDENDPTDAAYDGVLEYARESLADPHKRLMILTNSEIKPGYASTTAVADEMLDRLGIAEGTPQRPKRDHCELPGLRVLDWRVTARGNTRRDHAGHVNTLGPQLMADSVVPFFRRLAENDPEPPWFDAALSLGERSVLWSREQMRLEPKPSKATIAAWFRHSERNGRRLGITKGNHCAAGACAAALACRLPGDIIPHLPRAGAKEIIADAVQAACWHPIAEVRSGAWLPSLGDLAVYDRSKPGRPSTAWWGHVDRVSAPVDPDAGGYWNIGANEGVGGAWREGLSSFDNPKLLGFVAYPPLPPVVAEPRPPEPTSPGFELSEQEKRQLMGMVGIMLQDQAEAEWWAG